MNQPPKLWIVAERPVRLPSFCRKCRAVFEKLMGDVSPEFEIGDLARPPLTYQSTRTIDPGPEASAMASRRRWIGERLGLVAIIEMDCFDV